MPCDPADLARKAARIRLLLFDVDGVLTDGRILVQADGTESKQFSIRDGTGVIWAQRAGLAVGILSGRHSAATTLRAAQLGIGIVRQLAVDKLQVFTEVLGQKGLEADQAAFMGDDLARPAGARARRALGCPGRCRARGGGSRGLGQQPRGRGWRGPRADRGGAASPRQVGRTRPGLPARRDPLNGDAAGREALRTAPQACAPPPGGGHRTRVTDRPRRP